MSREGSKSEHTYVASFWYTFELISVASPPEPTWTPPPCREKRARACSSGAMEEMSRGFKMQTLTYCDATFMSTRTAAGQFKGQFKRVLDESSRKVKKGITPREPD
eukprot:scaffold34678_cov71-Phaeocystis_antarctica.AAC.2